jgi:hypothetical protein
MNNIKEYTVVDFPEKNKTYGIFKGSYPKHAASKAFSSLIKFIDNNNNNNNNNKDIFLNKFLVFVIKELNTNKNKEYKYICTRIKLNSLVKNKYKYKNVIGVYNPELDKIK